MSQAYDIIVAGSGPSGLASAIYAAQNGARVLLLERNGFVGGMSTSGMITVWCGYASSALYDEILEKLSVPYPGYYIYDNEELSEFYRQKLEHSGIKLLLYTQVCGVDMVGDRIAAVRTFSKDGWGSFSAPLFIDATGDGDVAALAGVPYVKGREGDGRMQPATLFVKLGGIDLAREDIFLWKKNKQIHAKMREALASGEVLPPAGNINIMPCKIPGTANLNMTNAIGIDGTKAEDLTRAELLCRSQIPQLLHFLRKHAPGYENCYVLSTASMIGIRETRHFEGMYTLTEEDIQTGRVFPDWAVSQAWFEFDMHNMTGIGMDQSVGDRVARPYTIPYPCFLPRTVSNLFLTGRNISGTHMAHSSYRIMPICFAMGQATGTAAALCRQKGIDPGKLDVKELQAALVGQKTKAPSPQA